MHHHRQNSGQAQLRDCTMVCCGFGANISDKWDY